jgi:hypothetical protein
MAANRFGSIGRGREKRALQERYKQIGQLKAWSWAFSKKELASSIEERRRWITHTRI